MPSNLTTNGILGLSALAICCVTIIIVASAQAAPDTCLYINSSGEWIPTIFSGLPPDAKFARVLSPQLARLHQQGSVPHFQGLVYREGCPKKTLLSGARTTPQPQACPCYGQYMIYQYNYCGGGNCGGGYHGWFYSGGDVDCSGYAIAGDACNGCEYLEQRCDPCVNCS